MKKKIITLCLVIALAATAIIGGTLAYFTDTDNETNTFTAGGVSIDLIEKERDGKGGLQDFTQDKTLMPIVGSAQGEKDDLGQPVAENYVDKIVTIKNDGESAAYIRAYFAIPSDLDDGYETFNAGANVLHFNFGNENGASTEGNQWIWKHEGKWNYFETTIEGVKYNVYFADYYQSVAANGVTAQLVSGVYLDKTVDYKNGKWYAFGKELTMNGGTDMNAIKCPVFAVAAQAAGFDDATTAINEAFGAQFNPWGGEVTNWQ